MLHQKIAHKVRKVVVPGISLLIFFQGCLILLFLQLTYKTLYCRNDIRKQIGLNKTKRLFIVLVSSILHVVAPSAVRITTENSSVPKGTFFFRLEEEKDSFSSKVQFGGHLQSPNIHGLDIFMVVGLHIELRG